MHPFENAYMMWMGPKLAVLFHFSELKGELERSQRNNEQLKGELERSQRNNEREC